MNAETNSPDLAREIAEIEQQLQAKRELLRSQAESGGSGNAPPHEKETLKEVVIEKFNPAAPRAATDFDTSQVHPNSSVAPTKQSVAPLTPPLSAKLQDLVNIAFTESIGKAVSEARSLNNPALVDALHDVIVDQLYDHMVERGVLKRF